MAISAKTRTQRLLKLADHVENDTSRDFDLRDWAIGPTGDVIHMASDALTCGTCGCIAGWSVFLFGTKKSCSRESVWESAQRFLGLSDLQANHLFFGKWHPDYERLGLPDATRKEAAEAVRALASSLSSTTN